MAYVNDVYWWDMNYTITDQNSEMIKAGVSESDILSAVAKAKVEYPDDDIYVTFLRADDGQKGYLLQNMEHSLVGELWK